MTAKPAPVPVNVVCSLCGLDWSLHGDKATTDDCIRLLRAELARRPAFVPMIQPFPYVPPTLPYPRVWWSTSISNTSQANLNPCINATATLRRPDEGEPPMPVGVAA